MDISSEASFQTHQNYTQKDPDNLMFFITDHLWIKCELVYYQ